MAIKLKGASAEITSKIISEIANQKIKTWSHSKFGATDYFTHDVPSGQWGKAWIKETKRTPLLDGKYEVTYTVHTVKGTNMSSITYAVYHGRFAEMLLSHFDSLFQEIELTSLPRWGDTVESSQ